MRGGDGDQARWCEKEGKRLRVVRSGEGDAAIRRAAWGAESGRGKDAAVRRKMTVGQGGDGVKRRGPGRAHAQGM